MKKIFKTALITVLSGLLFFGAAYAYLEYNLGKSIANVNENDYTVPYKNTPESCGIIFVFPSQSAILTYLDFNDRVINVLSIESYDKTRPEYYGYTTDYTVHTSYDLIKEIVDRVGGVNIKTDEETLRYTGVQVINLIQNGCDGETKSQIITEVFSGIAKNNFSSKDFVYIIENSVTNLSFIDCIYWMDYLEEMSTNINYID